MAERKAAVSLSGGKDSCLALYRARQEFQIGALITMFTEDGARSRSHGLRPEVLQRQAELLALELVCARGSWHTYEANFKVLLAGLGAREFTHIVFGEILLEEHRQWTERVCHEVGLHAVEPLWGEPTSAVAREFLGLEGQARIVAVQAELLDETWLGRPFDPEILPGFGDRGIDPCGEYGEFHTLVAYSPGFREPLKIRELGRLLHDGYWMLDLVLAGQSKSGS